MVKKRNEFRLNYDGGREKITRAMYSPQGYRRENKKDRTTGEWSFWTAALIGIVLGLFIHFFL